MDALRDNAGVLIIFLFLVDLVLIAGIFVLFRQLSIMRRSLTILKRGADGMTLVDKVASQALQIEELYALIDEQAAQKDYLTDVLAGTSVASNPRVVIKRRIFRLIPKSNATTRARFLPSGRTASAYHVGATPSLQRSGSSTLTP